MIRIAHLTKTYRVARKQAGLRASFAGLFRRTYEEVHAVRNLSFTIEPGERVGFLGPNGAGKTTTLKMLAGLLAPTSGEVSVLGQNPHHRPIALLKQITLVMGQKQQLLWDLPPIETLELNRAVYEVPRAEFVRTLGELTEMLELGGLLDKPARQLSLGERMKCELAAALLHRPKVLFLDEPTIGLDVTMQATVRRFIKEYNEKTGATVILTSHYMEDVAALCPRVIVIDKGALRHDGDLRALMAEVSPDKLVFVTLSKPVTAEQIEQIRVDGAPLRVQERTEDLLRLLAHPGTITETVRALLDALPVADLRVEDPPLEDIMRQVFGARPH
ncbi:ATP-binding cassette domain-containing protein [Myxococcota bacterium]|nr:ATP-binding cassette domain-containing protein [Myxococcota bacterium]